MYEVESVWAVRVGRMVRAAMEGAADLRVPLTTIVKVGTSLGNLENLEQGEMPVEGRARCNQ